VRWFYLTIIALFAAGVVIFAFQNFETVPVSFLGISIRIRIAILIFLVYVLGAVTGGTLFVLLRRSYERSRVG
jgi:putative membrane protein